MGARPRTETFGAQSFVETADHPPAPPPNGFTGPTDGEARLEEGTDRGRRDSWVRSLVVDIPPTVPLPIHLPTQPYPSLLSSHNGGPVPSVTERFYFSTTPGSNEL